MSKKERFWVCFIIFAICYFLVMASIYLLTNDPELAARILEATVVLPRYENDGYELMLFFLNMFFYGLVGGRITVLLGKKIGKKYI